MGSNPTPSAIRRDHARRETGGPRTAKGSRSRYKPGLARLICRYRPKLGVREDLEAGETNWANVRAKTITGRLPGAAIPNPISVARHLV